MNGSPPDPIKKTTLLLPRLQRSYSPNININKTPNRRISRSQKLLLPSIHISKSASRNSPIPKSKATRAYSTRCGVVYGYAVNSHIGLNRYKKEGRVSIIINIPKPASLTDAVWPRSSFFGLYDGNSGKSCSSFLKVNLHNYIFGHKDFPFQAKSVIHSAFHQADQEFLNEAQEKGDMSGSCALTVLIIGNKCIVANTGNSRAVLSYMKGTKVKSLTAVHVPYEEEENARVRMAGGLFTSNYLINDKGETVEKGGARVIPGKLQVTRAFGNIDAKVQEYGGNPKVVIVDPDIRTFKITHDMDFLLIGTDSFFEKISYNEAVNIVWNSIKELKAEDLTTQFSSAMDDLILEASRKRIEKNVTLVLIAFKALIEDCENHDN